MTKKHGCGEGHVLVSYQKFGVDHTHGRTDTSLFVWATLIVHYYMDDVSYMQIRDR